MRAPAARRDGVRRRLHSSQLGFSRRRRPVGGAGAVVPANKPLVRDVHGKSEPKSPVLEQWYKYNYLTHKLTARKNVYILLLRKMGKQRP